MSFRMHEKVLSQITFNLLPLKGKYLESKTGKDTCQED